MSDVVSLFPTIPHESAGVDCCGCIIVKVTGNDPEVVCNECRAVAGVVNAGILADLVSLLNQKPAVPKGGVRGISKMANVNLSFGRLPDGRFVITSKEPRDTWVCQTPEEFEEELLRRRFDRVVARDITARLKRERG